MSLTSPWQLGKTTLVRHTFPDKTHVLLEDPDLRQYALTDLRDTGKGTHAPWEANTS
jgi:hypothetical protein